ncbi:RagB/SusD family nutrient uptake outer membrane protein [Parapedobacter indicus]|uniref:Starch-binding associating with outer membrane n=1 Tax=Parapedobacter indicus TaxID=1477437 RepID=A0A1I3NC83_9SPHI|nr:RagB/SusD family nutrient uptake outer membrane protein [Parapedobacter indicus]PPL00944.1 putative outer membrane starch-binding protein [Parapedobacter indicus]SFJ06822.1 Starch-binding associating with outer membrane [Parapedobacter indicus]
MKKSIITTVKTVLLACLMTAFNSCSDFLDREPDRIFDDEQVFADPALIQSVLANFYGRVMWGQHINDSYQYTILDEAGKSDGGPDNIQDYSNTLWRVYDYELIRNINQFLEGLRASSALEEGDKLAYEGEARFLRAWVYFNMCRGMGGMPIVGDEVFDYEVGMDVTALQYPRSTEAGLYDYIISECDAIAEFLSDQPTINAARANRWAALMLKARAAIYAGSLANYNNKMPSPIRTAGGEVGIPAELTEGYYQTALTTAEDIINNSPYQLNMTQPGNLERNFYEALSVKVSNSEVIWARDHIYPGAGQQTGFTRVNIPGSHAEDIDRAYAGPILNLVEAFEYTDDRDGTIHIRDVNGDYIFYDNLEDAFANKDARLGGSVIVPGALFKGEPVILQAGQKIWNNGSWQTRTSQPGDEDDEGRLITSTNGPNNSNEQFINKTGFFFRKFLDEAQGASTRGRNSEMWFPRLRFAEALMIASEAALELGQQSVALDYLNQIRERAGIQPLESMTLDDIIRERRVEFAFEDHRYWDLKRWRRAHIVWNGVQNNPTATQYALFPYLVVAPGTPNDGKYVFDRRPFSNSPFPRFFQLRNYYNFIDLAWQNANPRIVLNPFQ